MASISFFLAFLFFFFLFFISLPRFRRAHLMNLFSLSLADWIIDFRRYSWMRKRKEDTGDVEGGEVRFLWGIFAFWDDFVNWQFLEDFGFLIFWKEEIFLWINNDGNSLKEICEIDFSDNLIINLRITNRYDKISSDNNPRSGMH